MPNSRRRAGGNFGTRAANIGGDTHPISDRLEATESTETQDLASDRASELGLPGGEPVGGASVLTTHSLHCLNCGKFSQGTGAQEIANSAYRGGTDDCNLFRIPSKPSESHLFTPSLTSFSN